MSSQDAANQISSVSASVTPGSVLIWNRALAQQIVAFKEVFIYSTLNSVMFSYQQP